MAQDQVDVMQHLGFSNFFVAGHDRGARTAFRMALDHPDKVKKFASFDILPTHHIFTHITREWALNSYHWFFMAQPYDIPEKLIEGKEDYYILKKLTKMGIGKGGFSEETLAEYARCCTPENIHGVCEDYRAGATIDFEMDKADFDAGRKIQCPAAIYWGELSHTEKFFDPREAWPQYCAEHRRIRVAAVRTLPGGAGTRRGLQRTSRFLQELARPTGPQSDQPCRSRRRIKYQAADSGIAFVAAPPTVCDLRPQESHQERRNATVFVRFS